MRQMQLGRVAGPGNKKASTLWHGITRAAGLKLFCPYAPPWETVRVSPVWVHIVSEAFSTLGSACYARMNITWQKSVKHDLFQVKI